MNTYTELTTRCKWVAVVVKNLTPALITITKGIKVTQVVTANVVPLVEVAPGTLEQLDEIPGIQQTKMSVDQWKEVLLQQLDLSGLKAGLAKTKLLLVPY